MKNAAQAGKKVVCDAARRASQTILFSVIFHFLRLCERFLFPHSLRLVRALPPSAANAWLQATFGAPRRHGVLIFDAKWLFRYDEIFGNFVFIQLRRLRRRDVERKVHSLRR